MKSCLFCSKNFTKSKKESQESFEKNRKFCSRKCFDTWKREKIKPPSRLGKIPWNKGTKGICKSWNKGKKMPEHVRQKLIQSHLGKKISLEQRIKRSLRVGEKANGWKGGLTAKHKLIRGSLEYRLWRTAVYERDNYTCIWCGVRNGKGNKVILNADHIKPFCNYPELRFAIDNGRTLCRECHKKTDTFGVNAIKK